jgi:hypothetical protein
MRISSAWLVAKSLVAAKLRSKLVNPIKSPRLMALKTAVEIMTSVNVNPPGLATVGCITLLLLRLPGWRRSAG